MKRASCAAILVVLVLWTPVRGQHDPLRAVRGGAAQTAERPILAPGENNYSAGDAVESGAPGLFTFSLAQGLTPQDLVDALLGPGVNVSNVQFSGANSAAGLFGGGTGIIGCESGVILSSGNIGAIPGPNDQDDATQANTSFGDPDLQNLIPSFSLFDTCLLEFDFECQGTQVIQFQYVFSSEEYNEYVFSLFNDVFGFFLNGQNIAFVPGSGGLPVAIDNVNCGCPFNAPAGGSFCNLYINNDCNNIPSPGSAVCGQAEFAGYPCAGNRDTEMDGLTLVFTATATLQPGVNHIKLGIADAGDRAFDSNVFLCAGTFDCSLPLGACCNTSTGICTNNVLESNCQDANEAWSAGLNCAALDPPCLPQVEGACCQPGGVCIITSPENCTAIGGEYRGDSTPCDAGACPTALKVKVEGVFIPLDKVVVPTAVPEIQVIRGSDMPSIFDVLVTRPDARAGILGAGKPVSVGSLGSGADLEEVAPNVFQGFVDLTVGSHAVHVQSPPGNDVIVGTMLNYSGAFEDLNENGLLEAAEDTNENGLLDSFEDTNSNFILDYSEDLNGNGLLTLGEDFNGNGALDPGEDFNQNGALNALYAGAMPAHSESLGDYGSLDEDELYELHHIRLDFLPNTSLIAIAAFLVDNDLEPIGVAINNTLIPESLLVSVRAPTGQDALELAQTLNGLSIGVPEYYPAESALPVSPPLNAALVIKLMEPPATALGERLPERLRDGEANGAGAGGDEENDGYDANNGGFDNSGDRVTAGDPGGIGVANTNSDELDIAFDDFIFQTHLGFRLVDHLVNGVADPARPLIALVDTGLGNGSGDALVDIAAERIVRPTNCRVDPCEVVELRQIPDAWTAGAASGDHGTCVAHNAAAAGTRVLGTGKDVRIRPIKCAGAMAEAPYSRGMQVAAADADVRIIVLEYQLTRYDRNGDGLITDIVFPPGSGNNELDLAVKGLNASRTEWLAAINALVVADPTKIVVFPAGNMFNDADFSIMAGRMDTAQGMLRGMFRVPPRGDVPNRTANALDSLLVGVSNTTLEFPPLGREVRHRSSNFGRRISVGATSQNNVSLHPSQRLRHFGGTSGAAPHVAGLMGELMFLDANSADVGPFSNLQIIELVEATADDLGCTGGAVNQDRVNNDPGNAHDDDFGHGRINVWKAVLSAANGGIATQHGRNAAGQNDSVFRSLRLRNDAQSTWYGFEIVTSVRNATVWLDGERLADGGAEMPNGPNITAYKGVRSDNLLDRGTHQLTDGSADDPPVVGPARPGRATDGDAMVGIEPVGTRTNNAGQYVMTFSVKRADLYSNGQPRTLSLRRPNDTVNAKPFYNLLMETTKMRGEGNPTPHVSGVVFDDFVFTITAADYGDANLYPTRMTESGARHVNSALEWLGRKAAANVNSVTGEPNAEDEARGGDPRVDADGVVNISPLLQDTDGRDDGVVFFPLTYQPVLATGKVQFTIGVADASDIFDPNQLSPGRYSRIAPNADPDRSLFFNLWIDWNGNQVWEEGNNEHVLDGVQITPADDWTVIDSGQGGVAVTEVPDLAPDPNSRTFECTNLPVGLILCGHIWARARLDYGENLGRNDPRAANNAAFGNFASLPSLRDPALPLNDPGPGGAAGALGLAKGAARYGEVEDYFIGADFGDAPEYFPGFYPTLLENDGAHHLHVFKEWLGPPNCCGPFASRERDAVDANMQCGGGFLQFGSDQDGVSNLSPFDKDQADDGADVTGCDPCGPAFSFDIQVSSTISTRGSAWPALLGGKTDFPADAADSLPRYSQFDAARRLYLSAWVDWNDDGVFDAAEKGIDEIVNPAAFGADGRYTLGEEFFDSNGNGVYDFGELYVDVFGVESTTLNYVVFPSDSPPAATDEVWCRLRLSYGEDDTTVDLEVKECDADGRALAQETGGALFGEVEDFTILLRDICSYARVVGEGTHAFNTTKARAEEAPGACGEQGPDIWFVYHATCTGTATIHTRESSFDTVIYVYDDDDCPPIGAEECNDDEGQNITTSLLDDVEVVGGNRYLIRVAGKGANDRGAGSLTISCKPTSEIVYVNQNVVGGTGSGDSWPNACPRLETALAFARASKIGNDPPNVLAIWVAAGVYTPDPEGNRTASFDLVSGVGIYGGFPGIPGQEGDPLVRNPAVFITILTGDLDGDDGANFANYDENSFHVVDSQGNEPYLIPVPPFIRHTVLDGFIIQGGNADGTPVGGEITDRGGNIFISGGRPHIRNCTIQYGSAEYGGGGAYLTYFTEPVISRCTFSSNRATDDCGNCGGGGLYAESNQRAIPYIANCRFTENKTPDGPASGGGGGAGGGVFMRDHSPAILVNCIVEYNQAAAGGGICTAVTTVAEGNPPAPQPRILNCTVHENTATGRGGGLYIFRSDTFVGNTIIWDNTAPAGAQVTVWCDAAPTFTRSDVKGGAAAIDVVGNCGLPNYAANNIDANPLLGFQAAILPGSPCVNAGDQALIGPPALTDEADLNGNQNTNEAVPLDIANQPRVAGANVDVGAFEVQDNTNPFGACCVNQNCTLTTQANCTGDWRGAGVACDPDPCIQQPCPGAKGDANCDGNVNFFDIDPFLLALFNPGSYVATFCGGSLCAVDTNCDGALNFFDIDPFLDCLFSGCADCP